MALVQARADGGPALPWHEPWLAPYRGVGEAAWQRVQAGCHVAEALDQAAQLVAALQGWRFEAAEAATPHTPYEHFVQAHRVIPTRHNLHDFFNGLVWLVFPALKRHLNGLHAQALQNSQALKNSQASTHPQAHPRPASETSRNRPRGPLRDALTLFDENGAWLDVPSAVVQALRQRHWEAALCDAAVAWCAPGAVTVVGHALLEKLCVAPRKALTAHALAVDPCTLSPEAWATKPFLPVPVLGIPGWCEANQDRRFYADPGVFRPSPVAT